MISRKLQVRLLVITNKSTPNHRVFHKFCPSISRQSKIQPPSLSDWCTPHKRPHWAFPATQTPCKLKFLSFFLETFHFRIISPFLPTSYKLRLLGTASCCSSSSNCTSCTMLSTHISKIHHLSLAAFRKSCAARWQTWSTTISPSLRSLVCILLEPPNPKLMSPTNGTLEKQCPISNETMEAEAGFYHSRTFLDEAMLTPSLVTHEVETAIGM